MNLRSDIKQLTLADVIQGDIKNGYSPNSTESETGYWVLGLGALTDAGLNPTEIKPVEFNDKVRSTLLEPGDFLVSRSNTPDKVGRSLRFKGEIKNCSYPDLMMRFRPNTQLIDASFLEYQLQSAGVRAYLKSCAAGSSASMVKITKSTVANTPIQLPPRAEQTKIAQILSTWDKAIATTERLLANSQHQKQALMQQLLTGQKPFTGFQEEWQPADFPSLFLVKNDKKTQTTSSNYLGHGATPIIDQGQALIAGYTDSQQVYKDVPVIVFGDHTRIIKWIDFEFSPGADGTQILKTSDLLDPHFGYYLLSNAEIPSLGYSRHMRELKEIKFFYPTDKTEQQKIAQVLATADAEITNLQAQLAKLKLEKKALMQQLLTGQRRVRLDDEAAA
ncbi:type I restriction enzyme S subunit [Pseudomonas sp. SJZ079]|uniref:restriction endonuclease subunit S n=1 Tax=Pseudomonas sp. SJZ079 TaxID=2572887 RepID=UPI00119A60C3|nr:restriction endonuclease subunit S [Pseudomonas sp. SJZ079]TWC41513.1 type I restriction enzyme S subunit [Pseudomonas sp. SJZ079]